MHIGLPPTLWLLDLLPFIAIGGLLSLAGVAGIVASGSIGWL